MPMQNAALFKAVKLKLTLLRWIVLCLPYKMLIVAVYVLSKNEKIIYTSVNPSFTI